MDTALQMLFDIHTDMQDADNFDPVFSGVAVKNQMFSNAVFEITHPDIVTRTRPKYRACPPDRETRCQAVSHNGFAAPFPILSLCSGQ